MGCCPCHSVSPTGEATAWSHSLLMGESMFSGSFFLFSLSSLHFLPLLSSPLFPFLLSFPLFLTPFFLSPSHSPPFLSTDRHLVTPFRQLPA